MLLKVIGHKRTFNGRRDNTLMVKFKRPFTAECNSRCYTLIVQLHGTVKRGMDMGWKPHVFALFGAEDDDEVVDAPEQRLRRPAEVEQEDAVDAEVEAARVQDVGDE